MSFDISRHLDDWDYQPGQVVVRRFQGQDGREKIQLRVDLGILQMNADGRPDGKRPFGHPSLFEYFKARLSKHREENDGNDDTFVLNNEECSKLQLEALQYHHRYICLLQLEDFAGVKRDTERNLDVFDFVDTFAEEDDVAWSLQQFRPQLLMLRTRAVASEALLSKDYPTAITNVEEGIESIRQFYEEFDRLDIMEQCGEVMSLESWLEDLREHRPLSKREKLEQALSDALQKENYEKAAKVRDALRKLSAKD